MEPANQDPALPLPDYAHVPGQNERPKEGFLDHIIRLAPTTTTDAGACANRAWLYGLRLMEEGFFWEAHEILEPVWMNAAMNSRERMLVQGIIHLTNAALKIKMGRPHAARKLTGLARISFDNAFGQITDKPLMGLEWAYLVDAAGLCDNGTTAFSFS